MWIKTDDRERAYRSAINLWLKSDPENMAVCRAIIEQNKMRREGMSNSYGASKEHFSDLRIGVSLPPGLYYVLLNLERFHGREFMKDKRDLHWFARKFPQFCICERI
jgi:hypothetical protein